MPKTKSAKSRETTADSDARLISSWAMTRSAPLVKSPSTVTLRAAAVIDPRALYTLLHLEALDVTDTTASIRAEARVKVVRLSDEQERWRVIASSLKAAITAARALSEIGGHGIRVAAPGGIPVEVDMLTALDVLSRGAEHEAQRISVTDWGDLGQEPGPLPRARSLAKISPKSNKRPTRARLGILCRTLHAADWTRPEIANLIAASQKDWSPAPVTLPRSRSYDVDDLESADRIVADAAVRKRKVMERWIENQVGVVGKKSAIRRRKP